MIADKLDTPINSGTNRYDLVLLTDANVSRKFVLERQLVLGASAPARFELGSVLTFEYRAVQRLHIIVVCDAENYSGGHHDDCYLRIGLDRLWATGGATLFSMVSPENALGGADGVEAIDLWQAAEQSYLPVHMMGGATPSSHAFPDGTTPSLKLLGYWTPSGGTVVLS